MTSAEAVLVQQQSAHQLEEALAAGTFTVVTLSPQARAALAQQYGLSLLQVRCAQRECWS